MSLIDWFIQRAWLVIGIVFFEGIYLLILKNTPQTCHSSLSCLGFYFVGSFIIMFLGAIVGLKLSKYRMLLISVSTTIVWVVVGIAVFEGFWLLILMPVVPESLIYPRQDMARGLETFFTGSLLFISLGAVVGLMLPSYFFHPKITTSDKLESLPNSGRFKNNALTFVATFVAVILILIANGLIIGFINENAYAYDFYYGFMRWLPYELRGFVEGFLLLLMVVIDIVVLYCLYKRIKDKFGAKVPTASST